MNPPTPEPSQAVETAKALIQQMSAQVGLLISLSLAICGGLLLLTLQTLTHNHDRTKRAIAFTSQGLLFSTLFLQGLSVVLGLFAYGAITDAVPAIFSWSQRTTRLTDITLGDADFQGSSIVTYVARGQILVFLASLVTASIFIFKNRSKLGRTEK